MTSVEVFADVWCPFTHVGLRRFVARRDELGADVRLLVRAWPLELINGKPFDPVFIAEEVDDLRAQVAPDLFSGFDPGHFPTTTLPALRLAAAANQRSPQAGEQVALDLRDRVFERGQDISADDVLDEVAAVHGLRRDDPATLDAVQRDWDDGRARGVIGSPHFFTPAGGFFCPALDVSRVEGLLRITPDRAGFEQFLDSCFGA